jgi:hypothetical protein
MAKVVVSTKNERKEREIELAWRKRESQFEPKVSKEEVWENFEAYREKALGY